MKGFRSKSARRYIALLLSFVMMAMTALTSVAEEPKEHDWQFKNGVWVDANDNDAPAKNAWMKDKDGAFYFTDEKGKPVLNTWIPGVDGSSWYYVGGDGRMLSGETITIKGKSYKFDGSGALEDPKEPAKDSEIYVLGWVKSGEGEFYYFGKTGKKAVGWHEIDEEWYYFEYDGKMFAGDQMTIDGVTYTFSDSGALTNPSEPKLKEGWVQEGKDFYYYENGDMVTDEWREGTSAADGKIWWYYLGSDGRMVTDKLIEYGDDLYYVNGAGERVSGWYIIDEKYYFFRFDDGKAVHQGWRNVGGGHYHFEEDCTLTVNKWVDDEGGKRYVDVYGEIVRDAVVPKDGGKAYVNKDGYFDATVNGEKKVGAITYTFKDGMVDESKEVVFATPSNAAAVDELLDTLDQLNQSGIDEKTREKVADALAEGARNQASSLTMEMIYRLDEALAEAYGIQTENLVKATKSDADLDVTVTGLVLASGCKAGDKLELVVEQASPATATKVAIDVELRVNGEVSKKLWTPVWLHVKAPAIFAEAYDPYKYTYTVVHTDNSGETTLPSSDVDWLLDETGDLYVDFKATSFSEYALIATLKPSGNHYNGTYTGSSSRTVITGKWVKAADGIRWWYQNPDGTWPANGWAQLPWNGKTDWYYFDAEGYMVTGWVTWENNRYYLHPISDGTQGYMYTGWHEIEGKWYYFRPESGGPQGSLFVNGTTPDGYNVDANGVWIQ